MKNKWVWFSVIFIIIVIILNFPIHKSTSDKAYVVAQEFVKEKINNPDTAEFLDYNKQFVEYVKEDDVYLVQGTVSYENDLNELISKSYYVALTTKDNNEFHMKYIEVE